MAWRHLSAIFCNLALCGFGAALQYYSDHWIVDTPWQDLSVLADKITNINQEEALLGPFSAVSQCTQKGPSIYTPNRSQHDWLSVPSFQIMMCADISIFRPWSLCNLQDTKVGQTSKSKVISLARVELTQPQQPVFRYIGRLGKTGQK